MSRGQDENSNGLCSCGLPRSEALRVASTLAPALPTAATSDCIQEVHNCQLHSEDPCQDTHQALACTWLDRVVPTASSN
jgi:hypothetical protein